VARVNLFSVFFHPTGYSITVFFIPPYSFLAAGLLLSSCWLAVFLLWTATMQQQNPYTVASY